MSTMPVAQAIAQVVSDEIADARCLLDEAQKLNRSWESSRSVQKAQAAAQMATGHVLLALGGEVAEIRREVAGLADAVRDLTATIAKASDPLAEGARALSDIALAVECLVPHERRWAFWRRRYTRPGLRSEVSA